MPLSKLARQKLSRLVPLALALLAACDGEHHPDRAAQAPSPDDERRVLADPLLLSEPIDPYQHKWWMEKAARTLTGREIDADDPAWAGLTRQEFVAKLVADKGFVDKTLGFNLYFLGFKEGPLRREDGSIKMDVLNFPHAVSAARAVAPGGDGDFLKLLSWQQPFYVGPMSKASLPKQGDDPVPPQPPPPEPPQTEIRAKLRTMIDTEMQALTELVSGAQVDRETLCGRLFPNEGVSLSELLSRYGLPDALTTAVNDSPQWLGGLDFWCFFPDYPAVDAKARILQTAQRLPQLFTLAETLLPDVYKPVDITDLKVVDHAALGVDQPAALTREGFYFVLQNSSTNYDRKRGSYILKRFFCDDLTPIALALPDQHAEDRHASDPGCQSCHYKLDPIAGFFKDRGVIGIDFAQSKQIIFDDLAQLDRETYTKAWLAPQSSGRKWDIGYVRSLEEPSLNSYGETMPDLFRIIGEAREVRQCLVRRMFEHFVGEEQVIDPGYLEFLTAKFEERARESSAAAYKETVERIVLGKTFGEQDLVSSECYDRAPDTDLGIAPPCGVNFLLQRHCATCHGAQGAAGGLDLESWIPVDGGEMSFPHKKGGRQLTKRETFQALYDRLSSTDRARRMPLGMHMPDADRETLFLWADGVLNGTGGH